jgi:hypothetical protein
MNDQPAIGLQEHQRGLLAQAVRRYRSGMPLQRLWWIGSAVTDLSPLKGMPLKEIACDFQRKRDAEILRSLTTLEKINGKPAAEFWKEVDGK